MEVRDLLTLAKNGDESAKVALIKKYYPFIVNSTKNIFLNSYTFEDLVQTGIESVLKGIEKFDLENKQNNFSSYVFGCIKNNFNYLCRKEIKNNNCYSLNLVIKDNMESMDFLQAKETLEEIFFENLTNNTLSAALKLLDSEEFELINFLYLNTPNDKKQSLSTYARLKNKDYYYCTNLKKRTLQKLKSSMQM